MNKIQGFTLIELTIVLIILSLLVAGAARAYKTYFDSARQKQLQSDITDIQKAMSRFLEANGHYPCPASLDAAPDTPAFGTATDCTDTGTGPGSCSGGVCIADDNGHRVRIGAVPTRSLGVGSELISDVFGNRFTYAVTEHLARHTASFNDIGGIEVADASGTTLLSTPGSAHFVLFSHGPDGKGSHVYSGVVNPTNCTGGTNDTENCDDDATFRMTEYARAETTDYFDDSIVYSLQYSDVNLKCPSGEVLAEIKNGAPICVPLSDITLTCGSGEFIYSLDLAGGEALCRAETALNASCAAGFYLEAISNNNPVCKPLNTESVAGKQCANPGDFIRGFDANGDPICEKTSPLGTLCGLARGTYIINPSTQFTGWVGVAPCNGVALAQGPFALSIQCPAGYSAVSIDTVQVGPSAGSIATCVRNN